MTPHLTPDAAARNRRGRLLAGVAGAALVTALLTACQPRSQFTIHNDTHENLLISHVIVSDTGRRPSRYPDGSVPPGRTNSWPIRLGDERSCATSYQLVATAPSGRTYTYGPPVCTSGNWTITDDAARTGN